MIRKNTEKIKKSSVNFLDLHGWFWFEDFLTHQSIYFLKYNVSLNEYFFWFNKYFLGVCFHWGASLLIFLENGFAAEQLEAWKSFKTAESAEANFSQKWSNHNFGWKQKSFYFLWSRIFLNQIKLRFSSDHWNNETRSFCSSLIDGPWRPPSSSERN